MKRIAISQSNYIPWKGYFDMIAKADEFVLYDDMQFTRRDWRNRNQIKTAHGIQWLSIPVMSKGNYSEPIKMIRIGDASWAAAHWKSIRLSYGRAPHFSEFAPKIEKLYSEAAALETLSEVNYLFLRGLCDILQISTPISWSMNYDIGEGKNEKLLNICRQAGATHYLSGPAAKNYIDEAAFRAKGLAVEWMDYSQYSDYPQRFGEFTHAVSVIDVIFNCGDQAPRLVWKYEA
jgi:hypothetical protein